MGSPAQPGRARYAGLRETGAQRHLTVYEAAPDKYLGITELPGIGKISSGSNGEVAWENSALQGPRVKQGAEKADAFRDGAFNPALNWQKLYAKGETAGIETVEGHECYKIVLTPAEGKPLTEFYDKTSGLLVKTMTTVNSQLGEISAEILYSDYQNDGGILSPHHMVNRAVQQEFVIQIQSVETNADLPKDRFDLPPEIQALVNKAAPAETKPAAPAANHASNAVGDGGKLTIYMAGKPMGSETYSVTRADGKIELDGSGTAAIGPMKVDIQQFKVVTTDKYQLIEADAKAKLGQIQMNGKITFADGKARNEVDTGQGPQIKEDSVHSDAIVVNAQLPLYPWSLLAMRAELKNQDPQQFMVYVLNQGEVPATVVFKGREPVEFGGGKTEVLNHLNGSGKTPQGQAVSLDFWVDDNRKVIKILVPSMGVEAYQDGYDRKAPPAAPDAAAPKGE